MNVLVINCGSSSIKYRAFNMEDCGVILEGLLERISEAESNLCSRRRNRRGEMEETIHHAGVADHKAGFRLITEVTMGNGGWELHGIGHRVVHGGESFSTPSLIDDTVIDEIRACIPLAPLHNPANLAGIEAARQIWPEVPQVAVFDTAFHHTIPPHASRYALPHRLYRDLRVRRYGFHGSSHAFVAREAARHLARPLRELNLITLHLGNGASATAISHGESVDTSMGMTPLEGLIMGTRCGDLDPALHFYLARETGMGPEDLEELLNRESGLRGICGRNDMREVKMCADAGDKQAQLAIDMFCYRVRKYIGAYVAVLGRVDAVVFTGGIGENASFIRKLCCDGLEMLGILIDDGRNERPIGDKAEIQATQGRVKVLVIRTNEELEIARQTAETIQCQAAFAPIPRTRAGDPP